MLSVFHVEAEMLESVWDLVDRLYGLGLVLLEEERRLLCDWVRVEQRMGENENMVQGSWVHGKFC